MAQIYTANNEAPLLTLPVELQEMIMDFVDESFNRRGSRRRYQRARISPYLFNYRQSCKWLADVSRGFIRRRIARYNRPQMERFEFHFEEQEIGQLAALGKSATWNDIEDLDIYYPINDNDAAAIKEDSSEGFFSKKAINAVQMALSKLEIKNVNIMSASEQICYEHEHFFSEVCERVEDINLQNKCWNLVGSMLREPWIPVEHVYIDGSVLDGLAMPMIEHRVWLSRLSSLRILGTTSKTIIQLSAILDEANALEIVEITHSDDSPKSFIDVFRDKKWPKLKELRLRNVTIRFEDLIRLTSPKSISLLDFSDVDLEGATWDDYLDWLRAEWLLTGKPSALRLSSIRFQKHVYKSKEWRDRHNKRNIIEQSRPHADKFTVMDILRGMRKALMLAHEAGGEGNVYSDLDSETKREWRGKDPAEDSTVWSSDHSRWYSLSARARFLHNASTSESGIEDLRNESQEDSESSQDSEGSESTTNSSTFLSPDILGFPHSTHRLVENDSPESGDSTESSSSSSNDDDLRPMDFTHGLVGNGSSESEATAYSSSFSSDDDSSDSD